MQKKATRIIMGRGNRESSRNLFKELNILSFMSQYILSLLTFVSNNREQYFANSEIHNINTRHTSNLHLPRAHLNIYQRGVHYSGIKIFNSLPRDIKTYIDNPRIFNPLNTQLNPICHLLALLGAHHILHVSRIRVKKAVKKFLYTNSFYSLNEYCDSIRINF